MNAADDKDKQRRENLFGLGFKWDGDYFTHGGFSLHWTDALCQSDNEWEKTLTEFERYRKQTVEKEV